MKDRKLNADVSVPSNIIMSPKTPAALCQLCNQFTQDLIAHDFQLKIPFESRWVQNERLTVWYRSNSWGCFSHHDSLAALESSAATCGLCALLLEAFVGADSAVTAGRLELFPMGSPEGVFRAVFSEYSPAGPYWKPFKHSFEFGRIREWEPAVWPDVECRRRRAVPESALDVEVWTTAREWMRFCDDEHPQCRSMAGIKAAGSLPTRVLDIGDTENHVTRLCISKETGISGQYAALSHCWGGKIDHRLTLKNLDKMKAGIEVATLPKNFQDAIRICRELNLRYLWIDALCIIQDSASDWDVEAAKMASTYAGSAVTISALESPSSDEGILSTRRSTRVIVQPDIVVQRKLPEFFDLLETCHLGTRGWCLQERLLAPKIIHIGKSILYWECRTGYAAEDAPWKDYIERHSSSPRVSAFAEMRKNFPAQASEPDWKQWYLAVGEYSTRQLSFPTDTFPALAGVATIFQDTFGRSKCTYVAGLFVEDMAEGLLWGPQKAFRISKAPGFNQCSKLQRPTEIRAPSWSWASVVGPIEFDFGAYKANNTCEILGVHTTPGKLNNVMAKDLQGSILSVRGFVGEVEYQPYSIPDPTGFDVGSLNFLNNEKFAYHCILDFERRAKRKCYVLVVQWNSSPNNTGAVSGLVMEKMSNGRFRRLGVFQSTYFSVECFTRVQSEFAHIDIDIE